MDALQRNTRSVERLPTSTAARCAIVVGLAALFAAGAAVATGEILVESRTPTQGTVGTTIRVSGSGFESGRTRAFLKKRNAASRAARRRAHIRRLELFDNEFVGVLRRPTPAGMYDLFVQTRGGRPVAVSGGFEVVAPDITGVNAVGGEPRRTLAISGMDFGTRTGRVFVGQGGMTEVDPPSLELDPPSLQLEAGLVKRRRRGRRSGPRQFRARVTSWDNTRIVVVLHPRTPTTGPLAIRLNNGVGEDAVNYFPLDLDPGASDNDTP